MYIYIYICIYIYYVFTENICSPYNLMQVLVLCKHVLILQNNDSNILTLKVAQYLKKLGNIGNITKMLGERA